MKTTILTLAILTALSCKAQTPIINMHSGNYSYPEDFVAGQYFKDIENKFAPFIGTWQWTNGTNTLTIVIEKIEMVYNNLKESYSDYLVGKYRYVENGIVIISTLNYNINSTNALSLHPEYPKRVLSPMLGTSDGVEANFSFMDYLKDKGEPARFELLDLLYNIDGSFTVTQARLTLTNREHWNINGENHRDPGFTIPNNIILVKQ